MGRVGARRGNALQDDDGGDGRGYTPSKVPEKTGEARRDAVKKRRVMRSRPVERLATRARSFFIDLNCVRRRRAGLCGFTRKDAKGQGPSCVGGCVAVVVWWDRCGLGAYGCSVGKAHHAAPAIGHNTNSVNERLKMIPFSILPKTLVRTTRSPRTYGQFFLFSSAFVVKSLLHRDGVHTPSGRTRLEFCNCKKERNE